MGSKRLIPTTVGKMASNCLLFVVVVYIFVLINWITYIVLFYIACYMYRENVFKIKNIRPHEKS